MGVTTGLSLSPLDADCRGEAWAVCGGSGIRSGLAMRGETEAHGRGGFREAAPVATDSVVPCYGWSVKS